MRKSTSLGALGAVCALATSFAIVSPALASGGYMVVVANRLTGRVEAGSGKTRAESEEYGMKQCKFWSDAKDRGACAVLSICERPGWGAIVKGGTAGSFHFGVSCGIESREKAVEAALKLCGKDCKLKDTFRLDGKATGKCVPDLSAPNHSQQGGACCDYRHPEKCASGVCLPEEGCSGIECSFHCGNK